MEREIREDLSLHCKHTAEDGMKKKAIHASADYDEFKNLVSAAQLKPTTSRDVSSLFTGTFNTKKNASHDMSQNGQCVIGGYGDSIKRRNDAAFHSMKSFSTNAQSYDKTIAKVSLRGHSHSNKSTSTSNTSPNKSSRGAYDFIREWKQQCKSPQQTISFLTQTKPPNGTSDSSSERVFIFPADYICKEYFSTDLDSEILGDIVDGLHLLSLNDQDQTSLDSIDNIKSTGSNVFKFVNEWLESLIGCGRFRLNVSFLRPEQTENFRDILGRIKEMNTGPDVNTVVYMEQYDKMLRSTWSWNLPLGTLNILDRTQ